MILLKNMAWDVFNAYCINFLSNGYTGSYLHSSCIIWAARLLRWAPVGKARLEFCRIFKMEIYAEMVTGWKPLAIFFKKLNLRCRSGFWIRPCVIDWNLFLYPLETSENQFFVFSEWDQEHEMVWQSFVNSSMTDDLII